MEKQMVVFFTPNCCFNQLPSVRNSDRNNGQTNNTKDS